MAVPAHLTTNAGGGITFGIEETFAPALARGALVRLLDDDLPPFAGFYLLYPGRRNLPPKLRAMIAHVHGWRGRAP
ncbi:LysR substrate-binding domain-containing protein [Frigidibacter sp. MR17.14]|uniref:LysR substrate-binding domain-containing protein n=1 Tax=Frigidibacter sp. MR17.14 TaxID=3126509 RepID=UPI003012FB62